MYLHFATLSSPSDTDRITLKCTALDTKNGGGESVNTHPMTFGAAMYQASQLLEAARLLLPNVTEDYLIEIDRNLRKAIRELQ